MKRRLIILLVTFVMGVAMSTVPGPARAAVDRVEDSSLGAPQSLAAVGVVAGVRVTWDAPADATTVTGYRVMTPQGFDRVTGIDVRDVVVDLEAPGVAVAISVVALHGEDTSSPVTVAGMALAPGGLQRVLVGPGKLADSSLAAGTVLPVRLTGRVGVPSAGVRSVLILARVTGATRPTSVQIGDGAARTIISVGKGESRVRVLSIPVSAGVTGATAKIRVTVGKVRVRIDALGWTTTAASSAASESGKVIAHAPARVLPVTALAKGARRGIAVRGLGAIPDTGVAAVMVTLKATAASAPAWIAVGPAGSSLAVPALMTPARTSDTVTLPVRLGHDGRIELRNLGTTTASVTANVTGWIGDGTAPEATSGHWTTEAGPVTVLASRLNGSRTQTVTVAGRGTIPGLLAATPPQAVLVRATATGTSATATPALSLGPTATTLNLPAVISAATRPSTSLTWVDLSDAGTITARNDTTKPVDVKLEVIGWSVDRPTLTADALVLPTAEASKYDTLTDGWVTVTNPATAPVVGNVLAAGPTASNPQGFLARITDVDSSGSTYQVATEPAEITDVIRDGQGTAVTSFGAPVSSSGADPGVTDTPRPAQRRGLEVGVSKSFSKTYTETDDSGASVSLSVTARVDFEAEANIDVNVGWGGVKAEISAEAEEKIHGMAVITGHIPTQSDLISLGSFTFRTFVVQIGPVPVVITPRASLALEYSYGADAQATATFDQSARGKVGVKYDDGIHPIKEFEQQPPTFDANVDKAAFHARLDLKADVALEFWSTATVGVGLTAGASINYSYPQCFIVPIAYLDARITAGVELPFGKDLSIDEPFRIKEWDLARIRVPGSEGCPWTGIVQITSAWSGTATHEGGLVGSRNGTTDLDLRRILDPGTGKTYWIGIGSNSFGNYSYYYDCRTVGSGKVDLPFAPDFDPGYDVEYQPGGQDAASSWRFGFRSLPGSTHVDDDLSQGCTDQDSPYFNLDSDLGVALALGDISEVMQPENHSVDRTFRYDVDTDTCGSLGQPGSEHWCHGAGGDGTVYSQSGSISITFRMTRLEDLDADGIPDANQHP